MQKEFITKFLQKELSVLDENNLDLELNELLYKESQYLVLRDSNKVFYICIFIQDATQQRIDQIISEVENTMKIQFDYVELLILTVKLKVIRYLYEPHFHLESVA
ncbi:hypothetical protein ABPG74_007112 [Tetrahymena malaccensis]